MTHNITMMHDAMMYDTMRYDISEARPEKKDMHASCFTLWREMRGNGTKCMLKCSIWLGVVNPL